MRDAILKALAPDEEKFSFGGQTVLIREMDTAAEAEAMNEKPDAAYRMLVRCVFDEAGRPVFTDEDIPALKKSSSRKLAQLLLKVTSLNGMAGREAVKNSAAGPAAG